MQRVRCAFAMKIPSLARHCVLIGFSSSKSRKLSKQTPQGRRGSDSDLSLWAPVDKTPPNLCSSWLQPQWSRSLTHPEEKEAADDEWWCLPSHQLLNLPKCLPTGRAREGLCYVLLLSAQLLFQTWNTSAPAASPWEDAEMDPCSQGELSGATGTQSHLPRAAALPGRSLTSPGELLFLSTQEMNPEWLCFLLTLRIWVKSSEQTAVSHNYLTLTPYNNSDWKGHVAFF